MMGRISGKEMKELRISPTGKEIPCKIDSDYTCISLNGVFKFAHGYGGFITV